MLSSLRTFIKTLELFESQQVLGHRTVAGATERASDWKSFRLGRNNHPEWGFTRPIGQTPIKHRVMETKSLCNSKGVELIQAQEQDPSGLWHLNNMDSHQQASVCCGPTACFVKGFVVCKYPGSHRTLDNATHSEQENMGT